jgi:serralysin
MLGRDKAGIPHLWELLPDYAEVNGGPGPDTLYGGLARIGSHIHAGDGWDTVIAGFGNDYVWGEGDGDWLYGDTDKLAGSDRGGIDHLYGGKGDDFLYGDAATMSNYARGGNDWLEGEGDDDTLMGDAFEMRDATQGGSDILYGGDGNDKGFGDAYQMSGTSIGGWDWLAGGKNNDKLYGDAFDMSQSAQGGGDILYGENDDDELYGDFGVNFGHRSHLGPDGNDRLDGGMGNDVLVGGGGNDTFVFEQYYTGPSTAPLGSGVDWIFDFKNGGGEQDKIDLSAYGISSFNDLTIRDDNVAHYLFDNGATHPAAIIELTPFDSITVLGVNAQQLSAADFIL